MGCQRHPYEGTVGVCGSCVSDRLKKESARTDRNRFTKPGRLSEEYFLWKEGASSSSSISKHGLQKGGRIVDSIASLIKTDYAIPINYEGPRGRDRGHRDYSTRSHASEQRVLVESGAKEDDDFRSRLVRDEAAKSVSEREGEIVAIGRSTSREICEITAAEPQRETGQTIHSLMDAEPKSGKFSRSTSKGSPASYFSRSGSKRQSWTVFWRSDKKDDSTGRSGGEELRSSSDTHERLSSRPLYEVTDLRRRRHSESSSRANYSGQSSRRENPSQLTLASVEEGCKRLADYDFMDRRADSAVVHQRPKTTGTVASHHSYERNRSWEQLGLAKLPFASVYAAPTSNNSNGVREPRRNLWKLAKKKSEKGEKANDNHQHSVTIPQACTYDDDLGQSSGRPTPCTNSCFPQSGGRPTLRREDAHLSHEKLRHRRLSIYSYGLMNQPQLTAIDTQLSFAGRSRGPRPYMYNGKQRDARDSYYSSGRIGVDYWDGDNMMSPCDHYVEVSHHGDGGTDGIVDFIPVSEAQRKAYDWMERTNIEGNRSPPNWIDRRGGPMELEEEYDDSLPSNSGDITFLGKEELTTVFEQDSESAYGEEYAGGATDMIDDHYHRESHDEELECTETPNSRSLPVILESRLAKGKSKVTEIEEVEEAGDRQREQQLFERTMGETSLRSLSARSLSDAGSYARESTDSEIIPARSSLRSLFFLDGDEIHVYRGGVHEEGRAYKPDNDHEAMEAGDWTPGRTDSEHKDGQANISASTKRSPWKNIAMSPATRRKFLWPRSSPQPHLRRDGGDSSTRGFGHHQTSSSFSDTDSQFAKPRTPSSTNENTSSNLMVPEVPSSEVLGTSQDEASNDQARNGMSDPISSLAEIEEHSLKSSPRRSSLSRSSSQQRASLSRSSSKSPQRTLSRCSSRRSRSSSWSSCLTDPAWSSAQSAPSRKGETGTHEKEGPFSSLIRLGKKLSRRASPANSSFNTSPWRSFSKGSPQRGESTG